MFNVGNLRRSKRSVGNAVSHTGLWNKTGHLAECHKWALQTLVFNVGNLWRSKRSVGNTVSHTGLWNKTGHLAECHKWALQTLVLGAHQMEVMASENVLGMKNWHRQSLYVWHVACWLNWPCVWLNEVFLSWVCFWTGDSFQLDWIYSALCTPWSDLVQLTDVVVHITNSSVLS